MADSASKSTTVAILTTAVFLLVGAAQARSNHEPIERTFDVKSGGSLIIESDSGSIDVETHKSNKVEVTVTQKGKDDDGFQVEFFHEGNDVKIIGDRESSFFGNFNSSVHYAVKVPKHYNVDLKTGGGSIKLSDIKGRVDAYTSGGSIKLGRVEGDVDVNTSGGSITVDEVFGNIDAHTSGGSIRANISKQPTADSKLHTSGGSVTVYLSPDIAVDLYARTSGGSVKSEFAVNGSSKRNRIDGEINGGGPRLDLKTSGGSIRIKEI